MNTFPARCRRLWMAMGLRGRLVAGYTALFAVLLLAIAVGETTVVRQVLIDDRKAALPNTAALSASILKQPGRAQGGRAQQEPLVGNNELLLASFAADGSVLAREAGADVQDVDPRQLLDAHAVRHDQSGAIVTYQRTLHGIPYLVQVQSVVMTR